MTDPVVAAVAAARATGLPADDPVVLGKGANVNVHLRPAPVVARVTVTLIRGPQALAAELAYARVAAERGAPVVPPFDEHVHEHRGLNVTLWRHVEHRRAGPADARAVGAALRRLHDLTADLDLPLTRFDRLDEVEAVAATLDHPDAPLMLDAIRVARERLAQLSFAEQPIHGDAHLSNAFIAEAGPLWADLENVSRGPREYDLAAAVWRTRVHSWEGGEGVRAGYGRHDPQLVDDLMPILAAFLTPWNAVMSARYGFDSDILGERIAFLRTFA